MGGGGRGEVASYPGSGGGGEREPGKHRLRMRLITTTFHHFCIPLRMSAHNHVTLCHGRTLYPIWIVASTTNACCTAMAMKPSFANCLLCCIGKSSFCEVSPSCSTVESPGPIVDKILSQLHCWLSVSSA